jgi:hypothetical protein
LNADTTAVDSPQVGDRNDADYLITFAAGITMTEGADATAIKKTAIN